ncbi:helix-turn-helix transcriptional regulator [Deltaproteobacteria bacterium PRO3]|nr:helix-turn-helix transcriptional regulator [Deltaproteobacteria bacterium PRO3]
MKALKQLRITRGISQRRLATLAGTSYKTLQLFETGDQDSRLSTLESLSGGLGYPQGYLRHRLDSLWRDPVDSVAVVSFQILAGEAGPWRGPFFNFVDAFRRAEDKKALVQAPPLLETPPKLKALLASTVEALCVEAGIPAPDWCEGVPPLKDPWFVSGMENLKAGALVESPAHFRRRNLFVLGNFLERL